MGIWAAAIPAAASALGGLMGMQGQNDANQANAKQAQINRDFQERMSNTQWQRGVQDMRAAGLNPALAYQQGGASSPSGTNAAPAGNALGIAGSAIATGAGQAVLTYQQIKKNEAEIYKILQDADVSTNQKMTIQELRPHQVDKAYWETLIANKQYEKMSRLLGIEIEQLTAMIRATNANAAQAEAGVESGDMISKILGKERGARLFRTFDMDLGEAFKKRFVDPTLKTNARENR